MKRFEVGKEYGTYDSGFRAIKVIKRMKKMILVELDGNKWRMKIRTDADGNEYCYESCIGYKWRDALTYCAKFEE